MRLLVIFLAGLLVALQYALWLGDKNLFDLHRLTGATEQTRLDSIALQQRNDKLVAEVIDLKEGGETVETLARSQFGFIKKGEVFYQIVGE
ncbi:MAG: septum formation initiator family protein [Gammaproteobacteria bacterium]|nr:septum formation initiator family protein [Gammaproteobacteria bacterium]MDD9874330.1 septum formation initiator family protein [Gammaproteobacteria bacterium]